MTATETTKTLNATPYTTAKDIWMQLQRLPDVSDGEIAEGVASVLESRLSKHRFYEAPIGPTDAELAFTLGAFSKDADARTFSSDHFPPVFMEELNAWQTLGRSFSRSTVREFPHELLEMQWNIGSFGLWRFVHKIRNDDQTVHALALLVSHAEVITESATSVLSEADLSHMLELNSMILDYMFKTSQPLTGNVVDDLDAFEMFRYNCSKYMFEQITGIGDQMRLLFVDRMMEWNLTESFASEVINSMSLQIFQSTGGKGNTRIHEDEDIPAIGRGLEIFISALWEFADSRWDPPAKNLKYIPMMESLLASAVSVYNLGCSDGINFPEMRFIGFKRAADFLAYARFSGDIDAWCQCLSDGCVSPGDIVSTDIWSRSIDIRQSRMKQIIPSLRSGWNLLAIAKHI